MDQENQQDPLPVSTEPVTSEVTRTKMTPKEKASNAAKILWDKRRAGELPPLDHTNNHGPGLDWMSKKSPEEQAEIRAKMSANSKGRVPHNKGKHFSEESKAKMRAAKLGKKHTAEHNAKIKASRNGTKVPTQ